MHALILVFLAVLLVSTLVLIARNEYRDAHPKSREKALGHDVPRQAHPLYSLLLPDGSSKPY